MIFPLNALQEVGLDASLLVSLVIGLGFGVALERGGFGSSKVLTGIFYMKNWRVLKVMFTAIVVAMLGLYLVEGAGMLVMDQVGFRATYLWAQILGGLLLGLGFVVGGYCPGTSVVGVASGKLDALFVLGGILLGIGLFEETFFLVEGIYSGAYMGDLSIAAWAGVPQGAVVLGVVLMALGAFWAVERFGPDGRLKGVRVPSLLRGAGLAMGAGVVVALVQFAGPGQTRPILQVDATAPPELPLPEVDALELAGWLVEGRPHLMVLDLRADPTVDPLPGALAVEKEVVIDFRRRPDLSPDRQLVVVDEAGDEPSATAVRSLRAVGLDAARLAGGAAAWREQVLAEEVVDPRAAALRLLVSGTSAFEGAAPPPPPKPGAVPPPRKKKKGSGC